MKLKNLIITIILFFGISVLYAQSWTQTGDPINGDAEWNKSGFNVRLSGDGTTVAVSAIEYDRDGFNSSDDAGMVRVYKNTDGTWKKIGQDIIGEQQNEDLGLSLSLNFDGTVLAVGAPYYDNVDQLGSGLVKIFKYKSGNWVQIGEDIKGSLSEEYCGYSIDLNSDGDIIAISTKPTAPNRFRGVRVYKNFSGNWEKLGNDLTGKIDDLFQSVSLNSKGDIIAMSGFYDNEVRGYVEIHQYNEDAKVWKIIGKPIEGKNPKDTSGWSVSLNSDGNIIAIGSPGNSDNGEYSGHTRIFKNNSGTWTQLGSDINGEYHKRSGQSVSLSADGNIVAIGSPITDGYNNAVKDHVSIYQYKNNTWNLLGEQINETEANSYFGASVSLSADGTAVAVGAWSSDVSGEHSGQTRIYKFGGSLDVENLALTNTTVFPNPTLGHLAVNSKISISKLQIYNTLGQLIMTEKNKKDIDISALDRGLYFLKLQDTSGNYTSRKIIKQ